MYRFDSDIWNKVCNGANGKNNNKMEKKNVNAQSANNSNAVQRVAKKVENVNVSKKDYSQFLKDMKSEIHRLGFCCTVVKNTCNRKLLMEWAKTFVSGAMANNKPFLSNLQNTINSKLLPQIAVYYNLCYLSEDFKLVALKTQTVEITGNKVNPDKNVDRYKSFDEKREQYALINPENVKPFTFKKIGFASDFKVTPTAKNGFYTTASTRENKEGEEITTIKVYGLREKWSIDDVLEAAVHFAQSGADFGKIKELLHLTDAANENKV